VSVLRELGGVEVLWIFKVPFEAFKQRPKDYCVTESVVSSANKAAHISSNNLTISANNWSLLNCANTEKPHRMHRRAKWSIPFR